MIWGFVVLTQSRCICFRSKFEPRNSRRATSTISTARTYAVTSGTNKLQGYNQITQTSLGSSTASISYTYNAAGDITNDGSKTFSFNAEQRLSSMATGATGTSPTTYYTHNALGQRVFKTEPITGTPTTGDSGFAFVYDEDGNLLAEYGTGGPSSTGSTEYIWLPTPNGPIPIAAVINRALFAVHTDNLNTPRRLSNTSTVAVWQWKYSAFGEEQPTIAANRFADLSMNPNPGTTTVASVTFNLRYPGQYADAESGLSYNYFRSYDSNNGRYTQADPIGLDGGWNRFGYVAGNTLKYSDPLGAVLFNVGAAAIGAGIGAVAGGVTVFLQDGKTSDIVIGAALGAAGGAVAGFTFGAAGSLVVGGLSGGIGNIAGQTIGGQGVNARDVSFAVIAGATGGFAGIGARTAGYSALVESGIGGITTAETQAIFDFGNALDKRYPPRNSNSCTRK